MKLSLEKNRLLNGSVKIEDAFWSPKLKTFFEITLKDTFQKLEKDGVIENYRNVALGKRDVHMGRPWHDGLFLETVRGAADYLKRGEADEALEAWLDGCIDEIEKAQAAAGGGYIHTMVLLDRPTMRYGKNGGSILWQHDLYNHGCLFEAAVHYYRATGKTKLLEIALRAANELADTIGEPPKEWIVPGHELPEYALLEMYELLCDEPELAKKLQTPVRPEDYRALAHFWIHGRGRHEHRTNHPQYMGEYSQDHAPIGLQVQAVGHAVRAVLYYTGITRLAMLEGDEKLLSDSLRIWKNVSERKLHINGGVGATHFEEKFGEDYDLPNTAYLETCASVGLVFWAESLSRATGSAEYFQIIERALYNILLSSVTLDGDGYFYRNPLTSDGSDHHWAWHTCPCCPPMFHKTFGMIDRLIYAQDDEGLYVNLFAGGSADLEFSWGKAEVKTSSALPWKGEWSLKAERAAQAFSVKVRVPEWAQEICWLKNGKAIQPETENGYALFSVSEGDEIGFTEPLAPRRMEAHPYVQADRGRVAVARGPLVYCAEEIDNHGSADFTLSEEPAFTVEQKPQLLGGIDLIHGKTADGSDCTFVPLYAWDNRRAGSMNVWLPQKGKPDDWKTEGWEKRLYRTYTP